MIARPIATSVVILGFCWLVLSVNSHGDDVSRTVAAAFAYTDPPARSMGVHTAVELASEATTRLDVIEMYHCMCDGGGDAETMLWLRWWIIAALFGGLPTAILLRREPQPILAHTN